MSIFVDKHELAERKDVINPNLAYGKIITFQGWPASGDSTHAVLNAVNYEYNYAGFKLNTKFKAGDQFTITTTGETSDNNTYQIAIFSQTTQINYGSNITFTSGKTESHVFTVNANSTPTDPPIVLLYAGKPQQCNNVKLTLNYLKVERGTVATPYVPAVEDLVLKSDYDALNSRLTALESKMGGRKPPKPLISMFCVTPYEREVA